MDPTGIRALLELLKTYRPEMYERLLTRLQEQAGEFGDDIKIDIGIHYTLEKFDAATGTLVETIEGEG